MDVKKSKEQIKEEQRARGYATYKRNLIPINERPKEEELEIRRKGQRAMMEVKRKRKTLKEILDIVGGVNATDIANNYVNEEIADKIKELGEDITLYDLVGIVQVENAIKGSTKSAEFVRDSIGERPKDMQEINIDIVTDNDRAMLENINNRLESLESIDPNRL